jgi:hypothetical protein
MNGMYPLTASPGSCVAENVKTGASAGAGGTIGAVAVMPSTYGSTVADSVAASLRFDGAVLQMSGQRCCRWMILGGSLLWDAPHWARLRGADQTSGRVRGQCRPSTVPRRRCASLPAGFTAAAQP